MENVPGITEDYNKCIINPFLRRLKKEYFVFNGILNSADFGVPQIRKRFVLHGVRKDLGEELKRKNRYFGLPKATYDKLGNKGLLEWINVEKAIGDLPPLEAGGCYENDAIHDHKCASLSDLNIERLDYIRKNGGSRDCLPDYLKLKCHKVLDIDGNGFKGHKDVYGIMDRYKPSPTITGGCLYISKGRYGHYEQNRGLSIREAARLQSFPDDFQFKGSMTAAALQIGNAVPVKLVKASGDIFYDAILDLYYRDRT